MDDVRDVIARHIGDGNDDRSVRLRRDTQKSNLMELAQVTVAPRTHIERYAPALDCLAKLLEPRGPLLRRNRKCFHDVSFEEIRSIASRAAAAGSAMSARTPNSHTPEPPMTDQARGMADRRTDRAETAIRNPIVNTVVGH